MFDISKYEKFTQVFVNYQENDIKEALKALGAKRCLIMTGKTAAKRTNELQMAEQQLVAIGVEFSVFDEVEPNPSIETVNRCIAQAVESKAEFILAIGAGSVFDASKAVAFGAVGAQLFEAVEGGVKPLPIVGILLASGTGSETTPYCRVTDTRLQIKQGIANKTYLERVYVNPLLQLSLPADQARSMYLDIACHCCEAFLCSKANELSREASLEGLTLLAAADQDDFMSMQYFGKIARASALGGCAINIAPCTLPHEMSYRLTIKYEIPHGATVAMIEPAYLRFCSRHGEQAVGELYRAFGGSEEQFEALFNKYAKSFACKVDQADFAWIAHYMVENKKTALHNGAVGEEELVAIFADCPLYE